MDKKEYQKKVSAVMPPSPKIKNTIKAYIFGGGICVIGQALNLLYTYLGASKDDASIYVAITLVALSAVLTGFGVFDKIARHAGAGTIVPITGFANSVVSPAIDSKAEGLILGVGAKIFTVAGPVLLYGTLAGAIWGVVYWIMGLVR